MITLLIILFQFYLLHALDKVQDIFKKTKEKTYNKKTKEKT